MAAVAESKIVERLSTLTPEKIERMSAADATRLWDVAVRIERAATSAVDLDDLPNPTVSRPTRTRLDDEPDDDEDEDDGDWAWLMRHPFEARLAVGRRGLARLHERLREQAPGDHQYVKHRDGQFPWCDHCGYTDCGLHRNELPRWSDPDRAYSDEFLRHVAEVYEAGRAEGNGLQAVIDMFGLGAVEAWLERARSRGFLTPRLR